MGNSETCIKERELLDNEQDGTERQCSENTGSVRAVDQSTTTKQMTVNNELGQYKYPFENLVFEGGGNKGLAYCGALEVLEEDGIMKNIKRFAGSSAGAITASLVAIGYSSADMLDFMGQDMSTLFLDHSFGYLSLVPNILRGYGWNPGNRLYKWLGDQIEAKTGKADINFLEVYHRYHVELCVVVTNVNMMAVEYFHPKTTPNVPIRDAVRMSVSIPGLFQTVQSNVSGHDDTYIDGGVMCNYPIHCFDGWWLSMKPEDSYLKRLYPFDKLQRMFEKKERFGIYNEKTLGFVVYTDDDTDLLRNILESRKGFKPPEAPDTTLGKKFKLKKNLQTEELKHLREKEMVHYHAVERFLLVLRKHNNSESIDIHELRNALDDPEFTDEDRRQLFGRQVTVEEAMEELDINNDKEIQFYELYTFIGRVGTSLRSKFLGFGRKEFHSFVSFVKTVQSVLTSNVQRLFVDERDTERTVGINTSYVGTTDFQLEQGDKDYITERGRESTEAFLKYYIDNYKPSRKEDLESPTEHTTSTNNSFDNGLSPSILNEGLTDVNS